MMFVRPNWKNAEAYSFIAEASLRRIAWEFLRRNPEYQNAFQEYALRVRKLATADSDLAKYIERRLAPSPTMKMFDDIGDGGVLDALDRRLHEAGFFAALPDNQRIRKPLDSQHGEVWGLDGMPNPAETNMFNVRFTKTGNSITMLTSGLNVPEKKDESGSGGLFDSKWLNLQIDLSLPLKVIESLVLTTIKNHRKSRIGKGVFSPVINRALLKTRYLEYLRILDGLAAGVDIAKIGEALVPSAENSAPERQRDKRFRAARDEAIRLQSEGYRVLPLLESGIQKSKEK